jgi:hypothetical protein
MMTGSWGVLVGAEQNIAIRKSKSANMLVYLSLAEIADWNSHRLINPPSKGNRSIVRKLTLDGSA